MTKKMMATIIKISIVMLYIAFGISNVAGLGEIIYSVPSPAENNPTGLEWDGENLWVSDANTGLIYHFDPVKNQILKEFRGPQGTKELAWDGNNLWVLTENRIYKLDPSNGNIISYFNKPFNGFPAGLAWDKKGFLWIGEYIPSSTLVKFNVYKVNPETGNIVYSYFSTENPDGISGMTWDGRHIWITDPVINLITEEDINGIDISNFWTYGLGTNGVDIVPNGLAFDGEFLWLTGNDCNRYSGGCSSGKIYKMRVFPEVNIDIVPDTINFRPRGSFPVVIFGSTSFDVTKIDASTVTLSGADVKQNPNGKLMYSVEDVNRDGFLDMTVHMNILGLQLPEGNAVGILMGDLQDKKSFIGKDNVFIRISRQIR